MSLGDIFNVMLDCHQHRKTLSMSVTVRLIGSLNPFPQDHRRSNDEWLFSLDPYRLLIILQLNRSLCWTNFLWISLNARNEILFIESKYGFMSQKSLFYNNLDVSQSFFFALNALVWNFSVLGIVWQQQWCFFPRFS